MKQGQVRERPAGADVHEMDVRFVAGESYEVSVRGHRVLVDQPATEGRTPRLRQPSCLSRRWPPALLSTRADT